MNTTMPIMTISRVMLYSLLMSTVGLAAGCSNQDALELKDMAQPIAAKNQHPLMGTWVLEERWYIRWESGDLLYLGTDRYIDRERLSSATEIPVPSKWASRFTFRSDSTVSFAVPNVTPDLSYRYEHGANYFHAAEGCTSARFMDSFQVTLPASEAVEEALEQRCLGFIYTIVNDWKEQPSPVRDWNQFYVLTLDYDCSEADIINFHKGYEAGFFDDFECPPRIKEGKGSVRTLIIGYNPQQKDKILLYNLYVVSGYGHIEQAFAYYVHVFKRVS